MRKTVSVLFADVIGSTGLGERSDPEAVRALMARFFAAAREVIEAHGGTVEKYIGDAVMAVFGVPIVHEDDALRATRAAWQLMRRVDELAADLRRESGVDLAIRTGVNTGPVVVSSEASGETLATGDAVNVAARLQQAAGSGEVWIGESTYLLVRAAVQVEPLGVVPVRGHVKPVAGYRLISVDTVPRPRAHRLDLPIIGRARELTLLGRVLEDVVVERRIHLFTLLGVPGVGKSRLVREFLDSAAVTALDCTVLRGHCLPYGEGLTYWAIAEAVKQAAHITDADSRETAHDRLHELVEGLDVGVAVEQPIGELVGLVDGSTPADELTWATRALLESLAATVPLILVLDDLQWAGASLQDLVEHVVELSRDAPILVLCVARPDLLESRPSWAGGKLNATTLLLEALPAGDAEVLAARLLGGAASESMRRRIAEAAEGNPLFVEEYAGMLVDEQAELEQDGGGWTRPHLEEAAHVPATIQALLAARLDRLSPPERAVAGRASVAGRVFETEAVVALSPDVERGGIGGQLGSLLRKELIRPERTRVDGRETYRFRHLLIRDAAYEALSKVDRAALHERFADWLSAVAGDRLVEYEEIVAYHLQQAYRFGEDLGVHDDHSRELAARAAEHFGSAARRATAREDARAASDLFQSALELARIGSPGASTDLALDLADSLLTEGQWEAARQLLDELSPEALADPLVAARVRFERLSILIDTDPTTRFETIDDGLAELDETFKRLGDERDRMKALRTRGFVLFARGRAAEATDFMATALEAGRRASSPPWMEPAAWIPVFDAFGPRPVGDSIDRAEAMLLTSSGHPGITGMIQIGLGMSRVTAGDVERGLRQLAEGSDGLARLGRRLWHGGGVQLRGYARLSIEDFDGADRDLREADTLLAAIDETGFRSTVDVLLAKTLFELGRLDEARVFNELGQSLAAPDDFLTQFLGRSVEARLASSAGVHDLALALAREAVAIAQTSDFLALTGDALLDLAEVELAAGEEGTALASATAALELYRRKGARPGGRRAERFVQAFVQNG